MSTPDYGGHLRRVAADVNEWGDSTPKRVRHRCLRAEAQRDELAKLLDTLVTAATPYVDETNREDRLTGIWRQRWAELDAAHLAAVEWLMEQDR